MTLKEAVELALRQNPDLVISRVEEQKQQLQVRVAKDPFIPKVVVGSGLAYSSGFPMSIEGASPSIFTAQAIGTVFNRSKSYLVAQAKESSRGAQLETAAKREDVAMKTASLFLDAEKAARALTIARRQVDTIQKVVEGVSAQVQEGRLLPIELRRAQLNLAIARQRVQVLEADESLAENSLAVVLGMQPADRIRAADENRGVPMLPIDEEEAVAGALQTNRELRRLESAIAAKTLEAKANRAERLPNVDLVAQYGLFAKFNHYEDYFRTFQRHNGQLGVSFRVPLYASHAATAQAAQADLEVVRMRLETQNIRNRVSLDTRKSFQAVKRAEMSAEVARLSLDLAREQVSLTLARTEEGKATLSQVEESRFVENEKWMEWLDSRYGLERARYGLLQESGDLVAALR
jgi:outer membrane protein TolC